MFYAHFCHWANYVTWKLKRSRHFLLQSCITSFNSNKKIIIEGCYEYTSVNILKMSTKYSFQTGLTFWPPVQHLITRIQWNQVDTSLLNNGNQVFPFITITILSCVVFIHLILNPHLTRHLLVHIDKIFIFVHNLFKYFLTLNFIQCRQRYNVIIHMLTTFKTIKLIYFVNRSTLL